VSFRSPTRRLGHAVAAVLLALSAAACASNASERGADQGEVNVSDWSAVRAEAHDQLVRWWMYGGDERVNRYVDRVIKPAAARLGVTLERVPVTDTADVVQRVLAEQRAGRTSGGRVDLIWINGENFAQGKQAGLWLEDWATRLPNARFVDWQDPTMARDFGVPVDGQESPWSAAAFVFALDRRRTPDPPRSFPELLEYARDHPGRVTYPAPPDFTGSAFVRLAVQTLGEDRAFALLKELKPLQWRGGEAFPRSESELNQLFGNGQVDIAMSYDPNFVATAVQEGTFPPSAGPFVFDDGTLHNVSYVTIPANAAHQAGALVVANLLLDPELQEIKAGPDGLGIPTVLDLSRLAAEQRELFEEASGPYSLTDYGTFLEELPPGRVTAIEERWEQEVLR